MGFGRALTIGLAAALIALILADPRLAAEPASSGADHPHQLAVMDADGKDRRVLPLWGIYGWSMSRSGRFIAYQAVDLMTMNVDGRPRYRRVIRNVGTGFNLDWSWNSRSIAFERRPDIWIVNLNDHRQRRIVRNSPRWSPDGRKLTFERPRGQV